MFSNVTLEVLSSHEGCRPGYKVGKRPIQINRNEAFTLKVEMPESASTSSTASQKTNFTQTHTSESQAEPVSSSFAFRDLGSHRSDAIFLDLSLAGPTRSIAPNTFKQQESRSAAQQEVESWEDLADLDNPVAVAEDRALNEEEQEDRYWRDAAQLEHLMHKSSLEEEWTVPSQLMGEDEKSSHPVLLVDLTKMLQGQEITKPMEKTILDRLHELLRKDFRSRAEEMFDLGYAYHAEDIRLEETMLRLSLQDPDNKLVVISYPQTIDQKPTYLLWKAVIQPTAWRSVNTLKDFLRDTNRELRWKADVAVEIERLAIAEDKRRMEEEGRQAAELDQLYRLRRMLFDKLGNELIEDEDLIERLENKLQQVEEEIMTRVDRRLEQLNGTETLQALSHDSGDLSSQNPEDVAKVMRDAGSASLLDMISAMVFQQYPKDPAKTEQEHFQQMAAYHLSLRALWMADFGRLPRRQGAEGAAGAKTEIMQNPEAPKKLPSNADTGVDSSRKAEETYGELNLSRKRQNIDDDRRPLDSEEESEGGRAPGLGSTAQFNKQKSFARGDTSTSAARVPPIIPVNASAGRQQPETLRRPPAVVAAYDADGDDGYSSDEDKEPIQDVLHSNSTNVAEPVPATEKTKKKTKKHRKKKTRSKQPILEESDSDAPSQRPFLATAYHSEIEEDFGESEQTHQNDRVDASLSPPMTAVARIGGISALAALRDQESKWDFNL